MAEECLAQGIEQLQLEIGMDSDGNGIPDYYTSDITAGGLNLKQLVNVRISVLARSVDLDTTTGSPDTMLAGTAQYANNKTYTLAGGGANGYQATANDHFYRKVSTSIAVVRNWAALCTNYFNCGGT